MPAPLSVVIPTLNSADVLPETAEALLSGATSGLIRELVVSDGGSTDNTREIAKELGAVWVDGPKGRGGQIGRGVAASGGDWVLILHADTHLSENWDEVARAHMNTGEARAGYFGLRFRATGIAASLIAAGANFRSRLFGLPYGDQGLLISRSLLDSVGGVPDMPLMEDVELARRLKGRMQRLDGWAMTSAERYQTDGWGRRVLRNLRTLVRYRLGVAPEDLVASYDSRSDHSSEN